MTIETKFEIGQVVILSYTEEITVCKPCPTCRGLGEQTVTWPSNTTTSVHCPTCQGSGIGHERDPERSYVQHADLRAVVRAIRYESHPPFKGSHHVSYHLSPASKDAEEFRTKSGESPFRYIFDETRLRTEE
jgi:hypothetical protein